MQSRNQITQIAEFAFRGVLALVEEAILSFQYWTGVVFAKRAMLLLFLIGPACRNSTFYSTQISSAFTTHQMHTLTVL
jgi:hypothetical protein